MDLTPLFSDLWLLSSSYNILSDKIPYGSKEEL